MLYCHPKSKKYPYEIPTKTGISGQNKEKQNYDKNTIYLPRQSSFMIMHTFADWGNTGQSMAESLGITTVSTTKAHGWKWDKGKGLGENF